jgi:hypothetical protein
MEVSVRTRDLVLAAVPLILIASWPRVAAAQSTVVVVSVRDSTGAPVLPSRIDVLGTSIFALGDSLGRVVLPRVPGGRRTLHVRGIGFEERHVMIDAVGDTLRLPTVVLSQNATAMLPRIVVF